MNPGQIEGFVRETLGCTCPAKVFAQIEDDLLPATGSGPPIRRIAIGGRLLIYLIDIEKGPDADVQLAAWVRQGVAERDRLGMNRFRLVLAANHPERIADAAAASFERLQALNDKVHLHVVANPYEIVD